jgi:acetyltransferase EpsM
VSAAPAELIVVGGGEHARVVIETAQSRPDRWRVVGFTDPTPCGETARRLSLQWLGPDDQADLAGRWCVIGLGNIGVSPRRRELAERLARAGARFASVVHQRAWASETAVVGAGAVVMAGAVVNSGASIGNHCIVNTGAIVEHDVTLGAYAHVGPAAAIGGGTTVGEGSYLGLGCRIRDHLQIGARVAVGMGAVVVRGVKDDATVMGVPARSKP